MVLKLAASASAGSLFEILVSELYFRPTESESLRVRPKNQCFNKLSQ
jgi:hypothetical protein